MYNGNAKKYLRKGQQGDGIASRLEFTLALYLQAKDVGLKRTQIRAVHEETKNIEQMQHR